MKVMHSVYSTQTLAQIRVLQSWSIRFKQLHEDIWLQYVRVCVEIGNQCIDRNPADRPDTLKVIGRL
jgi:hypothetical protein